jgi:hypothetical protein
MGSTKQFSFHCRTYNFFKYYAQNVFGKLCDFFNIEIKVLNFTF